MTTEQLARALDQFAEQLVKVEAASASTDVASIAKMLAGIKASDMKASQLLANILRKVKSDPAFREALASWTLDMQRGVDVSQMDDKCKSEIGDFGTAAGLSILLAIWGQAVLDAQ